MHMTGSNWKLIFSTGQCMAVKILTGIHWSSKDKFWVLWLLSIASNSTLSLLLTNIMALLRGFGRPPKNGRFVGVLSPQFQIKSNGKILTLIAVGGIELVVLQNATVPCGTKFSPSWGLTASSLLLRLYVDC